MYNILQSDITKKKRGETMNKATTVRLPESLKEKLKKAAVKRGMTLNNLVIQLLWESVNGLK